MTILKNYKEYKSYGKTFFREQYMEKSTKVFLWRYGYIVDTQAVHYAVLLRKGLHSRPNLKKLFGK